MKQNEIVFLLVSSFILVTAWIGFTLYNKSVTSRTTEALQVQVQPITPSFDTAVIEELKSRVQIEPKFEASGNAAATPTPTSASARVPRGKTPTPTVTRTTSPTPKVTAPAR